MIDDDQIQAKLFLHPCSTHGRPISRPRSMPRGAPESSDPSRGDLARHGAQVVPEVADRRPPPKPLAVIDAVDDEPRLEHERMRDHRIMLRVSVLRDVEVLLNGSLGVGEEGPLGAHRRAEFPQSVVVIGGDRGNPGVGHGDLRIKRGRSMH